MKKYFILYIIFIISFSTCTSMNDKRLQFALEFAGENRPELEKVLTHYKNDSEKLMAARFLIENMPHFYSYKGWQIDTIKTILSKEIEKNRTFEVNTLIIDDTLTKKWRNVSLNDYEIVYDAHIISAEYLIENIELSFLVRDKYAWNRHLPFEDFCELILPYRIGHEPLENWRKGYVDFYSSLLDSLYKGDDPVEACDAISQVINSENFYYCSDFELSNLGAVYLKDNRIGYCRDACDFILYVMRSIGIPVATDFYPYSPDNRLGHNWNVVRDTTGSYLQCGYTFFAPETGSRDDGRKKGKVYRLCAGVQSERFKGISLDNSIPALFRHKYIKDVTANYFGENEINIPVGKKHEKRVFLGVFTINGWLPIAMGELKNKEAVFRDIEPNVIYQTLSPQNGQMYPANYPFIYTEKGIHYFAPNLEQKEEAILKRKYPVRFYMVNSLNQNVRNSKFSGSIDPSFYTSEFIHEIKDSITTNHNSITISPPQKYRYIKYSSPKGKPLEMAEIYVYDKDGNPIQLQIIDSFMPVHTNSRFAIRNIIDDNPLSFTLSKDTSCHLTFDLGKVTEIHEIKFIPRNDENFIHLGDTYELFYNNGEEGWLSLGKQVAETFELKYQTPKGALLWLRNLSRGREEHIFYMENGKQVFAADIK